MTFFLILSSVLMLAFYFVFLKKTIVGFGAGNYIGIGFLIEFIFFILVGVILIYFLGVDYFWALFLVESEDIYFATFSFFAMFWLFFVSFLLFSNLFESFTKVNFSSTYNSSAANKFTVSCFIFLVIYYLFSAIHYNYEHALISALRSGVSLSIVRHENVGGEIPSFFVYGFIINSYLMAVSLAFSNIKGGSRKFLLLSALFFISVSGQKMPIINLLILYYFASLMMHNKKLSISIVLKCIVLFISVFILLYLLVKLQYEDYNFSDFLSYILNRAGVGFIAGYYEQMHLRLHDFQYIWHSVPFASIFIDIQNFHKDLMMISESRVDGSNIGIKNTLFFAEAYAIGGGGFMFLSPIIYAFNYLLSYVLLSTFLNFFVFKDKLLTQRVFGLVYVFYINLSGGFSDLFFFKSPILIFILITGPVTLHLLISKVNWNLRKLIKENK